MSLRFRRVRSATSFNTTATTTTLTTLNGARKITESKGKPAHTHKRGIQTNARYIGVSCQSDFARDVGILSFRNKFGFPIFIIFLIIRQSSSSPSSSSECFHLKSASNLFHAFSWLLNFADLFRLPLVVACDTNFKNYNF